MPLSKDSIKNCLVVSYGPVPTPQYQKIEGGGMRAWGLAKGLKKNGLDVTIGVNNSFPQDRKEIDSIKLINWSPDQQFAELLNTYDAVVVSYCMGNDSVFIADHINDDVLLVLDVYVPIYIEVSARNSNEIENEFSNYMQDIKRFNHVLKRGDYFLCANETQKIFYTGILGSLGVINPRSYSQDRVLDVPFGIHDEPVKISENPYLNLGINEDDKIILWFGGLYPWFRAEEFLDAIIETSKIHDDIRFVFVGSKNPFNNNPDLLKQYEKVFAFAKTNKLIDKVMFFVDWVDFDTRAQWYQYADFVVSLNQPGGENAFSWRTRVMDYVWGEIVPLTNGGDPLGEDLIKYGAAIRIKELSKSSIANTILDLYDNPKKIDLAKDALIDVKQRYYWESLTKVIAEKVNSEFLPFLDEKKFITQHSIGIKNNNELTNELGEEQIQTNKLKKLVRDPASLIRYAKRKGMKKSVKVALGIVKNQIRKKTVLHRQFILLSHPIDNSGAPLVLLQIIDELIQKHGAKNIRLITPSVTNNHGIELSKKRIRVQKAVHALSPRITGLQLGIRKNDFVLINTVAVYENYNYYIFNLLEGGRLKKACWFIHEDIKQTSVIAPHLVAPENINKISKLANDEKLIIFVPSDKVRQDYQIFFNTKNIHTLPLHVPIDKKYLRIRKVSDYSKINFFLSGSPADGRKGQLIAIAAFQNFIENYQSKNPEQYRNFSLHLIGIGDDYISTQIKSIGKSNLGPRLHIYPSIPREKALEVTRSCNAVICCSINETFALFVAEGMAMGHIVLRNGSAGMKEQLHDGVNGFYINEKDINQFSNQIEKILNKKISNNKLQAMGLKSQEIFKTFSDLSYVNHLDNE